MSFTIGEPIHISDAPPPHRITPPRAKAWKLYEALSSAPDNHFLPITFPDAKNAYYQVSALRKIAKGEGFKVENRPAVDDKLTKCLRLVKINADEETAA